MNRHNKILITGGAGYVGANLVPKLLANDYDVTVYDLYIYGNHIFNDHPKLKQIKGDIRDIERLNRAIKNIDIIIHLACISNDPSYELNPALGKSINYDAFLPILDVSKQNNIKRFIYASSSSVYGVKDEDEVTEELVLEPMTDYSKYKALCEEQLISESENNFISTIIRPSTVCGYSQRLRLDLTVNILTNHAINKGQITVFGGNQKRPNIHIDDMTDLYIFLLEQPDHKINHKIYNVGYENFTIAEIASIVNKTLGGNIPIRYTTTNDNRSYHISSKKIKQELGFVSKYTIEDAVYQLKQKFDEGKIPEPLNDPVYYNVKMMQNINLQ
jgi:nucleoside-diphosphate-sugar epimerase